MKKTLTAVLIAALAIVTVGAAFAQLRQASAKTAHAEYARGLKDGADPKVKPGTTIIKACVGGYLVIVDTRYATAGNAATIPDRSCPGFRAHGIKTAYVGN